MTISEADRRKVRAATAAGLAVEHAVGVEERAAANAIRAGAHPLAGRDLALAAPAQAAHGTRAVAHRVDEGAVLALPLRLAVLTLGQHGLLAAHRRGRGERGHEVIPRHRAGAMGIGQADDAGNVSRREAKVHRLESALQSAARCAPALVGGLGKGLLQIDVRPGTQCGIELLELGKQGQLVPARPLGEDLREGGITPPVALAAAQAQAVLKEVDAVEHGRLGQDRQQHLDLRIGVEHVVVVEAQTQKRALHGLVLRWHSHPRKGLGPVEQHPVQAVQRDADRGERGVPHVDEPADGLALGQAERGDIVLASRDRHRRPRPGLQLLAGQDHGLRRRGVRGDALGAEGLEAGRDKLLEHKLAGKRRPLHDNLGVLQSTLANPNPARLEKIVRNQELRREVQSGLRGQCAELPEGIERIVAASDQRWHLGQDLDGPRVGLLVVARELAGPLLLLRSLLLRLRLGLHLVLAHALCIQRIVAVHARIGHLLNLGDDADDDVLVLRCRHKLLVRRDQLAQLCGVRPLDGQLVGDRVPDGLAELRDARAQAPALGRVGHEAAQARSRRQVGPHALQRGGLEADQRALAPHILQLLHGQLAVLQRRDVHRVDQQPRGHVNLGPARDRLERVGDELLDLGDEVQHDRLALADAAHAERALRIVAEGHVLSDGQGRARVRGLGNVHARRMDLVVEREAALGWQAALGQRQALQPGPQQDHLAVLAVEEDHALEVARQVLDQIASSALVVESRDERARVDQRVNRRVALRHVAQQAARSPRGLADRGRYLGRGQNVDDLAVAARLVHARAQLRRRQIVRRATEAKARPSEEQRAAKVDATRTHLEALSSHGAWEDVLAQVVHDHLGQQPRDAVQLHELVRVPGLEQRQRQHRHRRGQGCAPIDARRARRRRRTCLARDLDVHRHGKLLQRARMQPALEEHRRGSAIARAHLALQVLLELSHKAIDVREAETLIAVRKDGQADEHVGVRKLGRAAGHILADERDGQQAPRLGGAGVQARQVCGREDAVAYAVDLRQAVRQDASCPFTRQIQQALALRG
eukprot:m.228581 g.228581  ORF g.228581 m.228581 type:complete len:1047 (-) comp11764_c0_seq1:9565-12705(-)